MVVYEDIQEEVEEKVCLAVAATMSSLRWMPRPVLARVCHMVVLCSLLFWTVKFSYQESHSISMWGESKWRSFRESSKPRREEKKLRALNRVRG